MFKIDVLTSLKGLYNLYAFYIVPNCFRIHHVEFGIDRLILTYLKYRVPLIFQK